MNYRTPTDQSTNRPTKQTNTCHEFLLSFASYKREREGTHVGNNPMEATPGIPKPMLPSRQLPKVLRRLWNNIIIKLEHNPARRLRVNRDIELHHITSHPVSSTERVRRSEFCTHENVRPAVTNERVSNGCSQETRKRTKREGVTWVFLLLMQRWRNDEGRKPFCCGEFVVERQPRA